MADVFTSKKRSWVMSRIRSKGNSSTELAFIKVLRRHKISGWRRNYALVGRPDFVFPKQRVVVFVDGCFWHNCPVHGHIPKSRPGYWRRKIERNVERSKEVKRLLRKDGWKVLRIWECEIKDSRRLRVKLRRLHGHIEKMLH
ncbi:MAG: very short patch repair endonuclease [Gammaproteobacteria bacterium]|nr:very short patch repair endonuclease [Gammaproteobacteria bacterium]